MGEGCKNVSIGALNFELFVIDVDELLPNKGGERGSCVVGVELGTLDRVIEPLNTGISQRTPKQARVTREVGAQSCS